MEDKDFKKLITEPGFYKPINIQNEGEAWEVITEDEGIYVAKTQFEAEVLSRLIKLQADIDGLKAKK